MMRKLNVHLSLLMTLLLLASCMPPQKIIEDLGIVTAFGFDLNEDDGYKIKATTVIYQFNAEEKDTSQVLTGEGTTIREARNESNKSSMHYVVPGHLNIAIFGRTIAEQGIAPYLDTLARNAEIPNTYHIAMSLQPANEILNASNFEDAANLGVYLERLLMNAVDNEIIIGSRQYEFFKHYFEPGQDPILPMLMSKNEKIEIEGIALLQNDKYVGHIDSRDAFYLRLLKEKFKSGELTVELPLDPFKEFLSENYPTNSDHLYVSIHQIDSDSKIKLVDKQSLKYHVDVDFKGKLLEISVPTNLEDEKSLQILESEIEKKLEEKLIELINMTKEVNADPIGFGKIYSSTIRGTDITNENWREMYPNIEVEFNVNINITRYGTIK